MLKSILNPSKKAFFNPLRRIYLNHPKFQLEFVSWFIGLALFALLALYLANQAILGRTTQAASELGLGSHASTLALIAEHRKALRVIFMLTAAIVVCILALGGLILSNRVAGPLQRLENHMRRTAESDQPIDEINFRKSDYFQEVAEAYNLLLAKIRELRSK